MFKSIIGIGTDIVKIAAAPIEIVADITRCVTKTVADAATDVKDSAKEETQEKRKGE